MTNFSDNKFNRSEKTFTSLEECIKFIAQYFPEPKTANIKAIDIDTGNPFEFSAPAHFYRGEKSAYPTTVSSMQRLEDNACLSYELKKKIKLVTSRIDSELQEFLHISPMYSAAYLQHYGLPTELLDITSSLDIAAFFASCGRIGDEGLMCVLSVDKICHKAKIIDLTNHPCAERPRWQSAYAFFHDKFIDLKKEDCINDLGLRWFSFVLNESDIIQYRAKDEILDAHRDKVAGMIQIIVDDFEKLDDEIAEWLSTNIVPAPFIAKIVDYWEHKPKQPKTVELVSIEEAALEYIEDSERENNYRKWSILHPEIRPHKLKAFITDLPLE